MGEARTRERRQNMLLGLRRSGLKTQQNKWYKVAQYQSKLKKMWKRLLFNGG